MVFSGKNKNLAALPSSHGYIHWKFNDKMSRADVQKILNSIKGRTEVCSSTREDMEIAMVQDQRRKAIAQQSSFKRMLSWHRRQAYQSRFILSARNPNQLRQMSVT